MLPVLRVKSNVRDLALRLGVEATDIPKRVATALTRTALEVRKDLRTEMLRVFDRPTPFTLNSLFVRPATATPGGGSGFVSRAGSSGAWLQAQYLTATVWLKGRGAFDDSSHLEPQIFGGARPPKPFEERLRRIGVLPDGMFAVPGEGARLDRYGNMSRGQLVQILSQLRAIGLAGQGSDAQPTSSRRSRRNVKKAGTFFVGRPGGGRLPLGVWQRIAGQLKPVLIFVRGPRYQARFKFYEVAERTARREFPLQFERAAAEAAARRALPRAT